VTHADKEGTPQAARLAAQPNVSLYTQNFLTWQGWWAFQFSERIDLIDLVSGSTVEPVEDDDGRIRWKTAIPGRDDYDVEFVCERMPDGGVRLAETVLISYRTDPLSMNKTVEATSRCVFQDYREVEGAMIPFRAVILIERKRNGRTTWAAERIVLNDVVPRDEVDAEVAGDLFAEPYDIDGMVVADERVNLAYVVGSQEATWDGRLIRTSVPLRGTIEEVLRILEGGEAQVPPRSAAEAQFTGTGVDRAPVIDRSAGFLWVSVAAGLLLIGGGWWVLRKTKRAHPGAPSNAS